MGARSETQEFLRGMRFKKKGNSFSGFLIECLRGQPTSFGFLETFSLGVRRNDSKLKDHSSTGGCGYHVNAIAQFPTQAAYISLKIIAASYLYYKILQSWHVVQGDPAEKARSK